MAVLNITWETVDRVSPATAAVTGTAEEAADAEPVSLEQAVWVFIHETGDADAEKVQKIALDPDKVRIGSKYFRCVKMSPDNAKADPLLAEFAEDAPAMVFVSTEVKVVEDLSGKGMTGSKIFKAMEKTAKKSYKVNLKKNVKSMLKVLNELDKIADEISVLEQKEAKDPNPAEQKKLAKERKELDERQEKAIQERDELLKVESRVA